MKTSQNTILITGGSSGIGFELSRQLLAAGNTVLITGRDPKKLESAKTRLPKLHTLQNDVSRPDQIEPFAQKVLADFPKLNVLINNAGIMKTVNFNAPNESLAKLTEEIDINLKGPIQMTQAFLPHLKKQPEAAVMFVSSGLAFVPLPSSPVYCATKAALHSFAQSLRVQMKKTGVKVFEIAPPATETELLATMSQEDRKGISIMSVQDMVQACLRAFAKDQYEIRPGQANQLKFMSRVAPEFILKQLSKPAERMPIN